MTVEEIKQKVRKTLSHNEEEDFVAAAVRYNVINKEADHSGLIICLSGELWIFHFDGIDVILERFPENKKWYLDKAYDFIKADEVVSFYYHCKNIQKEANPSYGMNYNGSYFKTDTAQYYSDVQDFQLMTCVGFCLNVITGAIESHKYILQDEWEMADHEKDAYFIDFLEAMLENVPKEHQKSLKNGQRRIYPSEYLACSLISTFPISKGAVDLIISNVKEAVTQISVI